MRRIEAGAVGMMLSLAAACTAPEVTSEAHGHTSALIIHGVESGTEHDAVVLLSHLQGWSCTATMVAPNLILTAVHCVAETEESGISCNADGTSNRGGGVLGLTRPSDIQIFRGATARANQQAGAAPDAMGAQILTNGTTNLCGGDMALVVLDRVVAGPYAPLRLNERTRVGEKLTAVGWGLTETGALPLHRMTRSGIVVKNVGPATGLPASDFEVSESGCNGDSGGPVLSAKGAVVGVVSRGGGGNGPAGNAAASCIGADATETYVNVSREKALVERAFQLAGAEPILETAASNANAVSLTWNRTTANADYSLDVQLTTGEWLFPCVNAGILQKQLSLTFDGSCTSLDRNLDLRSIKAFRICWAENGDWANGHCAAMPYNGVSTSVTVPTPEGGTP